MTTFEWIVAGSLAVIALACATIAANIGDLRRDVAEIWKRMPRID